ncbi:MAG: DUF4957 domain-containing protein [Bacteroidales bacterium]|nr:DUF4957 domain-containing protein [Bacteroidales bacterium]MCB9000273.1 DUF4957 domain-containing protein [Bacteroidales bacterium]MCB9012823.1 DUF4957 domain-containing protein [Bacteroidales bacterium]
MKKVVYLIIALFLTASFGLNAQQRITLNQGDDLIAAIASAASGDTIAIGPGFHKLSYATPVIDKSLSFIAVDPAVKPKIFIKQMDIQGTDLKLYFHGLNISTATVDSLTGVEDTVNLVSADSYILNLTSSHISLTSLILDDCVFRNIGRAVLRGDRAANTIGDLMVNNCVIYDHRGAGDYGPFRVKSNCTITNFTIQNSTFYNISNRVVEMESAPGSPAILIKNCTFNNFGGGKSGQYIFDLKTNTTASLVIQNCILGKTNQTDLVVVNGWRVPLESTNEMNNTAMTPDFIVTDSSYSVVNWDKIEYNLESFDPEWEDPANGNFRLPENSALLEASPEGTIIGDPRWAPISNVAVSNSLVSDINVYPNPASDILYIKSKGLSSISIYNSLGVRVKVVTQPENVTSVNISELVPGLYFVKTNDPALVSKFIVK